MEMWIGVAVTGGLAVLIGLFDAVRRYSRGEIRPLEIAALLVASCGLVSVAVVRLSKGHDPGGHAEIAIWLLIAIALWIDFRSGRRATAGPRVGPD